MVAGAVTINATPRNRLEMKSILKSCAVWVYVPFFTLAGAALDLSMFGKAFGVALALFMTRAVSIVVGTWLGVFASGLPGKYGKIS